MFPAPISSTSFYALSSRYNRRLNDYIEFQLALAWESEQLRLDPVVLLLVRRICLLTQTRGSRTCWNVTVKIAAVCLIT